MEMIYSKQHLLFKKAHIFDVSISDFCDMYEMEERNGHEYCDIRCFRYGVVDKGHFVPIKKITREKYDGMMYHIVTNRGYECIVSPSHKIMQGKEYISADKLYVGDEITVNAMIDSDRIRKIGKFYNDTGYIYGIDTTSGHYACGGIMVSSLYL